MKFAFALLPIAAALGFVEAGPVAAEGLTKRAPVQVTKLVCDGDTYKCTASLDYGGGDWVAQWSTSVFHHSLFGYAAEEQMTSMAPVPVTALVCDGDTRKCTAKLRWGDGNWLAQWKTKVFHEALFDQEFNGAMAPVPVKRLTCDGNSHKCTAVLGYGDGRWVAEWEVSVFQVYNGV